MTAPIFRYLSPSQTPYCCRWRWKPGQCSLPQGSYLHHVTIHSPPLSGNSTPFASNLFVHPRSASIPWMLFRHPPDHLWPCSGAPGIPHLLCNTPPSIISSLRRPLCHWKQLSSAQFSLSYPFSCARHVATAALLPSHWRFTPLSPTTTDYPSRQQLGKVLSLRGVSHLSQYDASPAITGSAAPPPMTGRM